MAENRDSPATAEAGGGIPTNTTTTNTAADATTVAIEPDKLREPVPGIYVEDDFGSYHGDDDEGNHQTPMPTKMANVSLYHLSLQPILNRLAGTH